MTGGVGSVVGVVCTLSAFVSIFSWSAFGWQSQSTGLRDFATALAANRAPSGVIAPEAELTPKTDTAPSEARDAGAYRRTLPDLLAAFNKANPAFRATQDVGVVHVTATTQPTEIKRLLRRRVSVDRAEQMTAGDAMFRKLVTALRGSPVGAIAGTGPMPGSDCPLSQSVRVSQGTPTVGEFMDAVVSQAPGLVWLLTYDPDQPDLAVKVGFVCPDGTSVKMKIHQ